MKTPSKDNFGEVKMKVVLHIGSTLESRIIVYTRNLILKIFRDTRSYSGHTRSRRRRKISNFLLFEDLFIGKFLENEIIHNGLAYAL